MTDWYKFWETSDNAQRIYDAIDGLCHGVEPYEKKVALRNAIVSFITAADYPTVEECCSDLRLLGGKVKEVSNKLREMVDRQ